MYRLVIVDDEEKIVDGMVHLFPWENIGFKVVGQFSLAREALAYIDKNPVDVVLTDVEMPEINGLELCGKLAEYDRPIQAVLFSSYSNYEYFRAAIKGDVVDYLLKPVAYSDLLECFGHVKERLDEYYKPQKKPVRAAYYEQIVQQVTDYLRDNFQNASLEKAAAKVNLSPTYLSRVFKEKSGTSFSALLLQTRMEKASEMLRDIQYKSYDIAFFVGYDNPKNFSRAFKAYYGVSPSDYRKASLKEL